MGKQTGEYRSTENTKSENGAVVDDRREASHEPRAKAPKRLVIEAQKGDAKAVNQVIELYYKDLLYFAMKEVGFHDGADVVQQTIARLVTKLEDLKDPDKIKSWMMSAVYRECLNFRKRKKRQSEQVRVIELNEETLQIIDDTAQAFDDPFASDKDEGLLFEALEGLPKNYATTIRLRYKDDLSNHEIAEVLGVDEKKVRNDMHRGLKLLGKRIEEKGGKSVFFALGSTGALPFLTEAFEKEQALLISPEMASEGITAILQNSNISFTDAISNAASSLDGSAVLDQGVDAVAAASGTATAATVATTVKTASIIKVGIGSLAALALTATGAAFVLSGMPEEESVPPTLIEESAPEAPQEEAVAPEVEEEAPINTIADMIGEEEAALLAQYESEGVDEETWLAFIARIEAQDEGTATEPDYTYTLHRLIKQDKQLVMAGRQSIEGGTLQVISEFGPVGDLPRIVKVIQMFP